MSEQQRQPGLHATEPPVDLSKALEWVDQDRDLLSELVGIFLDDYPQRVAELRDAIMRNEAPLVQRVAHGLKGSVSGFGAPRARNLALRLETLARAGDLGEAVGVLAELEAELSRVAEGLSAPGWRSS